MDLETRINSFVELGKFLSDYLNGKAQHKLHDKLDQTVSSAIHHNGWFTVENIKFALKNWADVLTQDKLEHWLDSYQLNTPTQPKTIAVIMAGNIPLVGFHDFLCVLLSGNNILVKQSSNDQTLLPVLSDFLIVNNDNWSSKIEFTKEKLEYFDAVIATGSNNTARYFEYYFSNKPNIIRKNRNSVALISRDDTKEDLKKMGEDIFRYYGLGCRNVSKIYIPHDFKIDKFYEAIFSWQNLLDNHKYANNYDYNKAVYLMSEFSIFDNGFLLLKEDTNFSSPIGTLFFERYNQLQQVKDLLNEHQEKLQCIVSNQLEENHIAYGQTQKPSLRDYADNVDTLNFLKQL